MQYETLLENYGLRKRENIILQRRTLLETRIATAAAEKSLKNLSPRPMRI